MKYYSTNNKNLRVSLRDAVFRGLAEDGGLFMPERIPSLHAEFFSTIENLNLKQIAFAVSKELFGEDIPDQDLENLVYGALNFDTPLVKIDTHISTLELFHGPTLAFKDIGARFTARMLGHLIKDHDEDINVLVATSGDTGSAVANGFLGVEGINVHVLYPKGKVSKIQEIQFTTLGKNITSIEVDGTFDDCQKMVKQAFNDNTLQKELTLTSANSINLARLLPQSFYYFDAYRQSKSQGAPVFCVPSGNFGNLTAGLIAARMGLPVKGFIAATNVNDIVPGYLSTGKFEPRPSVSTLANAMDVGNPSNFARMLDLYKHSAKSMNNDIQGFSCTDEDIRKGIRDCYKHFSYLPDPHGSVGYLASREYTKKEKDNHVIFLETAHPAKFGNTVKESSGIEPEIPERLKVFFNRKKQSIPMAGSFDSFREYLRDTVR